MLFKRLFGSVFDQLPQAWQTFHDVTGRHVFEGRAVVWHGEGFLIGFLLRLLGLPAEGEVPLRVILEKTERGERWHRYFGASCFSTHLTAVPDRLAFSLYERFAPFCFFVKLHVEGETVHWHLHHWWVCAVPLPRGLMPKSDTTEFVDELGRYCFDISIHLPFLGPLISYKGWLTPVREEPSSSGGCSF